MRGLFDGLRLIICRMIIPTDVVTSQISVRRPVTLLGQWYSKGSSIASQHAGL